MLAEQSAPLALQRQAVGSVGHDEFLAGHRTGARRGREALDALPLVILLPVSLSAATFPRPGSRRHIQRDRAGTDDDHGPVIVATSTGTGRRQDRRHEEQQAEANAQEPRGLAHEAILSETS